MSSYIPIASQTLGSSASSVTFSSIPTTLNGKTLRDLVLVCFGQGTTSDFTATGLRFNSDTGANYTGVFMYGDGSSAQSGVTGAVSVLYPGASAQQFGISVPGQVVFNIMDFAQTDKHKSVLVRWSRSDVRTDATAARWASTAAINSITIGFGGGDFAIGSTFSLFGLEG